ncbi:lipopolysaccharide export system protein LptA [uncultured Gammaproteobacteria bacterium]
MKNPWSVMRLPAWGRILAAVWLGGMIGLTAGIDSVCAQSLPGGGASTPGGSAQPVEIKADNALEWHEDQKAYVARGNAWAKKGTTTITADLLTAYYRETPGKGTEIYRIVAVGNVHVLGNSQEVFGEHGVYDSDKQVAMVTGDNLRLVTKTDVVTARDSLEYYEATRLAVARGDAIAVRDQKRMRADVLIGRFVDAPKPADGKTGAGAGAGGGVVKPAAPVAAGAGVPGAEGGNLEMDRIDGEGHVVVTTATDVALADRLMYSVKANIAILTGNVKITRGDNQINGDAAEMNIATHINRLINTTGKPVEALLVRQPGKDSKDSKAGKGGAVISPNSGTGGATAKPAPVQR